MKGIELKDLVGGAVQEQFSKAFDKIVENLQNPNTSYRNTRKITIELKFTQNEARDDVKCAVSVSEKLATQSPLETGFAIGTDLKTGKTLPKKDNPNAGGSGQTKSTWAVGGPTSYIKIYNHELDQEDHYFMAGTDEPKSEEWNINKHYSAERRNLSVSYFEIAAKNNPKYTGFNEPQFTIDEEDEVGSAKADIKLYAQQERIKFVTGELDINDDKAWQSYLDGFAPLYNEEYLKCSQAAFDRMYKTAG